MLANSCFPMKTYGFSYAFENTAGMYLLARHQCHVTISSNKIMKGTEIRFLCYSHVLQKYILF